MKSNMESSKHCLQVNEMIHLNIGKIAIVLGISDFLCIKIMAALLIRRCVISVEFVLLF